MNYEWNWKNQSNDFQKKLFQDIMNLSSNEDLQIEIWRSSKEEVQKENSSFFKELLKKCKGDISKEEKLWENTIPDIQEKNFNMVMTENFDERNRLWKKTAPIIQQKNLEQILSESEKDILQQLALLQNTDPSAKIENADFIWEIIEDAKNRIFEENQKLIEQNLNLENEEDRNNNVKKIDQNKEILCRIWQELGAELQNTEKGKEYFFECWKNVGYDNCSMWLKTSAEFTGKNFKGILENYSGIELSSFRHWVFNAVSDEALIEKENFSFLYKLNNQGQEVDDDVYDKISELFNLNHKIVRNIDFKFLSEEDLLSNYTHEQLLRITNYPLIQEFIYTECYEKGNFALKESIKYMLDNDKNWIINLDKMAENITENTKKMYVLDRNYSWEELIKNISKIEEKNITDDFKQQLLSILFEEKNYFDINTYDDVCNYTNIRNEVCEKIFNGELENIPQKLQEEFKDKKQDLYKFALLEHQFGISFREAKELVDRYGEDSKDLPEGEIKDYLILLEEITNCNNIEDIINEANIKLKSGEIKPWLGSVDSRNVEGMILNLFENLYNEVLYDPRDEEKNRTEIYVDEQGEEHKLDVFEIEHDFSMRVRVEGAYRAIRSMENFKEYYGVPDMTNHGNCESFIRQDSISGARPKDGSVMVGYSKISKNQLTMMAPYDMGSANDVFSIYNYRNPEFGSLGPQYRIPEQMINNTRHTHNEMVTERYFCDENGNLSKLKPDFAIWIKEDNSQEENKINDTTKKLASQLGIPIVVINREKFAQMEFDKISVMERLIAGEEVLEPEYQQYVNEFKNLSKTQMIEEIIIKYGNNRTGIQFNKKLREKYFTLEQFKNTIEVIEKSISTMEFDLKKECINSLAQVCLKEAMKIVDEKRQKEDEQKYLDDWKKYLNEVDNRKFQELYEMQTQENEEKLEQVKHFRTSTLLQQYLEQGIDTNFVTSTVKETQRNMENQNNISLDYEEKSI